MKRIPVTWRIQALVDDEDYERCKPFRWHLKSVKKYKQGALTWKRYVYTKALIGGEPHFINMPRFILNVPPEYRVTYVNNNHLDCRKANLKVNGIRQDLPRLKHYGHAEMLEAIAEVQLEPEDLLNA